MGLMITNNKAKNDCFLSSLFFFLGGGGGRNKQYRHYNIYFVMFDAMSFLTKKVCFYSILKRISTSRMP